MRNERPVIRCAIYTRKSSEEGLEQEFNSLDAQFEACSAYIASQKSEGWKQVSTRYDDGGFSGETIERPGLARLLADIEAGRIDMVVVYKIDRLTRSLMDFSKIVEQLDRASCSFASVTQSFNTATSMGRLVLNVLLSFAQFEREVTAERIRDKFAASKKKGIWMGGNVPLGYFAKDRQLMSTKMRRQSSSRFSISTGRIDVSLRPGTLRSLRDFDPGRRRDLMLVLPFPVAGSTSCLPIPFTSAGSDITRIATRVFMFLSSTARSGMKCKRN